MKKEKFINSKIKILPPKKQISNFIFKRMSHFHNQIKGNTIKTVVSKIQAILLFPFSLLKSVDEYITGLDQNITSSMDFILDEINISKSITNIFKGKQTITSRKAASIHPPPFYKFILNLQRFL